MCHHGAILEINPPSFYFFTHFTSWDGRTRGTSGGDLEHTRHLPAHLLTARLSISITNWIILILNSTVCRFLLSTASYP